MASSSAAEEAREVQATGMARVGICGAGCLGQHGAGLKYLQPHPAAALAHAKPCFHSRHAVGTPPAWQDAAVPLTLVSVRLGVGLQHLGHVDVGVLQAVVQHIPVGK